LTNSSLPTDEVVGEVGANWYPTRNFYLTATVGWDNRDHNDSVTVFHEQSYPYSATAWYRVTPEWSLTAGYADFTDFVAQDINVGDVIGNGISEFRGVWRYAGREHVFHVGTSYALTPRVLLTGRVEYVDGIDRITQAQGTSADLGFQNFDFIPDAALQSVQTIRVISGVDWKIRPRVAAYFRYIFQNYDDRAVPDNSGQVHLFLGGFSAFF
jgi:predicted porin